MSTRGAALKNNKQTKNEFSTHHDYSQHCEFCVLSFQTRPDLNAHILTHFKKKTCLQTQKKLLLIAGDWFELHINNGCTVEQCDSEVITDAVHISQQWVKKEESLKENDLDDDGVLSDWGSNIMVMKMESGSEINVDTSSSESWSNSSEKKVSKFELTEKESKSKISEADSISASPAKRKKVISTTKKKNSTPDRKTVQPPKSKRTKCRICKLNFTQETITSHLQTRHVPKIDPIPTCQTCGKTFSTSGNLRSHQYLHAGRGRYICSYCGKEFVRNANLKEHINLHTGARPFVCEICKKTFHRETLLRNHRRIHTGEKKYRCNIENCERAYMFDIDLKRHKFSAHGIYSKQHPCFICSKIFSENKLLKKHLLTHDAH